MNTKQNIPNTLRIHRKKAGLRQLDIARHLGHECPDRISYWEKGQTLPHMITTFKT